MADESEEPWLGFYVSNKTSAPLRLWFEPLCNSAEVPSGHSVRFRASVLGDERHSPSAVAAAFGSILQKLNEGAVNPEIEMILTQEEDGALCLTLWLDETDAIGFGELPSTPNRSA